MYMHLKLILGSLKPNLPLHQLQRLSQLQLMLQPQHKTVPSQGMTSRLPLLLNQLQVIQYLTLQTLPWRLLHQLQVQAQLLQHPLQQVTLK